jgi:hypothetical protein
MYNDNECRPNTRKGKGSLLLRVESEQEILTDMLREK